MQVMSWKIERGREGILMNPMQTFDPNVVCRVHDSPNDQLIDWLPEWATNYREYASEHDGPSVVSWDGLLLHGWLAAG